MRREYTLVLIAGALLACTNQSKITYSRGQITIISPAEMEPDRTFQKYELFNTNDYLDQIEYDRSGKVINEWHTVMGRNINLFYHRGELVEVHTRNPDTNCKTERVYNRESFVESEKCGGKLVRLLDFDAKHTFEEICKTMGSEHSCKKSLDGKAGSESVTRQIGNTEIQTIALYGTKHPYRAHEKTSVYLAPNGDEITTYYSFETDYEQQLPSVDDQRWQKTAEMRREGHYADSNQYRKILHLTPQGDAFFTQYTELYP